MAVVDLVGWKTEIVGRTNIYPTVSMRWKVGLHLVRDWVSRHGQLRVPPEMSGCELWLKSGASSHGPGSFLCHVYEQALFAVRGQRPIVVFDTSDK